MKIVMVLTLGMFSEKIQKIPKNTRFLILSRFLIISDSFLSAWYYSNKFILRDYYRKPLVKPPYIHRVRTT